MGVEPIHSTLPWQICVAEIACAAGIVAREKPSSSCPLHAHFMPISYPHTLFISFSYPCHTLFIPLFMPCSYPFNILFIPSSYPFHILSCPFHTQLMPFSYPFHTLVRPFSYRFHTPLPLSYPIHTLFMPFSSPSRLHTLANSRVPHLFDHGLGSSDDRIIGSDQQTIGSSDRIVGPSDHWTIGSADHRTFRRRCLASGNGRTRVALKDILQ